LLSPQPLLGFLFLIVLPINPFHFLEADPHRYCHCCRHSFSSGTRLHHSFSFSFQISGTLPMASLPPLDSQGMPSFSHAALIPAALVDC
jgi:hypothetical protein